jgi:hypothetical protein
MVIPKNLAARVVLTLLLIACAMALVCSARFYTEALVDAFLAFALASVLILHLRVRPKISDALLVLAVTVVLGAVDFRLLHFRSNAMAWLSFVGVSSFLIMAIRAVWTEDRPMRRMLLCASIPAALFVASDYFASTMLGWTAAAHPKTLDLYLLSFDYSLRVQLVFFAGQMFVRDHWLHFVSLLAYVGLAIPISLVYAGRLIRFKEKAFPAMLAFLITGPMGILFYNLFPACGPLALFRQGFPFVAFPMADAPRLLLEPTAIAGARNAMPSLHMAWMLLAWWYSRGLSWFERLIVFSFLGFTAFATLGTGEHWFVDLVVAFPFALLIQGICAYRVPWKDSRRLAAFFFGLLGTLAWLVMLRYGAKFFWTSPIIPWGIAAATVTLACIRQAKLDQSVDRVTGVKDGREESASQPTYHLAVPAK